MKDRESCYLRSMVRHGYKHTRSRTQLKINKRYIVVSTKREDADGVDFWIKPAGTLLLIPIQITQRGVKHFLKKGYPNSKLEDFIIRSRERIRMKKYLCKKNGVVFILLNDFSERIPTRKIAQQDEYKTRIALLKSKYKPFLSQAFRQYA